jgi:Uncharacterized protein conserved in bacteria
VKRIVVATIAACVLAANLNAATPAKKTPAPASLTPASMHAAAHDYYEWTKKEYPVAASDQGFHDYDDRLTDYTPAAIARRAAHVHELLEQVRATKIAGWSKDDQIDWLLFRSQLERADFPSRVLRPEEANPQVYTGEASNAIFSLLKKEYAPPATRAKAAIARLEAMPAMIEQGEKNLHPSHPARLAARHRLGTIHRSAADPESHDHRRRSLQRRSRRPRRRARRGHRGAATVTPTGWRSACPP